MILLCMSEVESPVVNLGLGIGIVIFGYAYRSGRPWEYASTVALRSFSLPFLGCRQSRFGDKLLAAQAGSFREEKSLHLCCWCSTHRSGHSCHQVAASSNPSETQAYRHGDLNNEIYMLELRIGRISRLITSRKVPLAN